MYSFMTTYADNVALPALAAVRRAAATTAVQQSIDISYPPGPQQQTRRTLLQRTNGIDRQTDRRTPCRHRPRAAYYACSANNET